MNEGATAAAASDVAARLAAVKARIADAARRAGRSPDEVTLVAVSKTFDPDHIRLAIEAGAHDLGENRVQEAEDKVPALPAFVHWHLIGHLQRNKINKALDLFSLIHSVDTLELGRALGERAARRNAPVRVLLQVNVAEKESQFGFAERDVDGAAEQLMRQPGLVLEGLMCIAPAVEDVEATRPYFRRVAALHAALRRCAEEAGHPWNHLSMGMSGDYPIAIEEGATLIRVGRAIFGERSAAH